MQTEKDLKDVVRQKYASIAKQEKSVNEASCCGATEPSEKVYKIMSDDYSVLDGYAEDADLGLGCGLPTEFAQIQFGDTVIDLGSGAGNDCFVARHEAGPVGKVIGIDFTEEMVEKAKVNARSLGYSNVDFILGDIEDMPLDSGIADVVVSNCVLNLLPSKDKIFSEIHRVLNANGHFSISDIVILGALPAELQNDAEMYAGCVAGAIQKEEYLGKIADAGFYNITIQKEKPIHLPDDILKKYLDAEQIAAFRAGETGIFSITVYASKSETKIPMIKEENKNTCSIDSGCC